jgi:hypothetical protein
MQRISPARAARAPRINPDDAGNPDTLCVCLFQGKAIVIPKRFKLAEESSGARAIHSAQLPREHPPC